MLKILLLAQSILYSKYFGSGRPLLIICTRIEKENFEQRHTRNITSSVYIIPVSRSPALPHKPQTDIYIVVCSKFAETDKSFSEYIICFYLANESTACHWHR